MKTFTIAVLLLTLCGCSSLKHGATGGESLKLKGFLAKSDRILIQKSFGDMTVSETKIPDKESAYGIGSVTTPGTIYLEPTTVEQADRSGSKVKGVVVTVQEMKWVVYGGPNGSEHGTDVHDVAALDEDEVKDLKAALAYMRETVVRFQKNPPADYTHLIFQSRDNFRVSVIPYAQTPTYEVGAGSAVVALNTSQMAQLEADIGKAVDALAAH